MNGGFVMDNLWHHAAMVIDATSGRMYVDGVLKGSNVWVGTPQVTTNTYGVYFNIYQGDSLGIGQEDDTSIWNTNLTLAQIQHYMTNGLVGNESGLVAYWPMNEGSGTNFSDVTGHGYDGTLIANPPWVASGFAFALPDPGYALSFFFCRQQLYSTAHQQPVHN